MSAPQYFVGLMSGTSLDGIDAALVEFSDPKGLLVHAAFQPYPQPLRARLLALNSPQQDELHCAATCANELAQRYAEATAKLLAAVGIDTASITAIGCHGQTIRHRPDAGYTIQLVNGALLAELTGNTVVCDFRSRDIAAGGQGAPLAPAFHDARFRSAGTHRAIVNIGGISNITDLAPQRPTTGFDCGPGNVLLDGWVQRHLHQPYDAGGAWAATGTPIASLLEQLLRERFFALRPPKSTGRELFNLAWLEANLKPGDSPPDVQATLVELTSTSIVQAAWQYCAGVEEIFACGGGAHNTRLMSRICALLPNVRVGITDEIGVSADWVEACAFAWLARQTLNAHPGNLPEVTGAAGERILGAIYRA